MKRSTKLLRPLCSVQSNAISRRYNARRPALGAERDLTGSRKAVARLSSWRKYGDVRPRSWWSPARRDDERYSCGIARGGGAIPNPRDPFRHGQGRGRDVAVFRKRALMKAGRWHLPKKA